MLTNKQHQERNTTLADATVLPRVGFRRLLKNPTKSHVIRGFVEKFPEIWL